jgi:uncharacterized small protein (DUF1192 family)
VSTSACLGHNMSNAPPVSLQELEQHIAMVRENIRQLIEQAAASSGAGDEDRNADRIAQLSEELERLTKERETLLKAMKHK